MTKNKAVTAVIIVATVILAGVAIFTAIRLYQLRQQSISPVAPETPFAQDCQNYTFSLDGGGIVTATNNSTSSAGPQQARVFIDNQLITTLDVPALSPGQSVTLGVIDTPSGSFTWRIEGSEECSASGEITSAVQACEEVTFTISGTSPSPTQTPLPTNTPLPTATKTPTPTPTPTDQPIGGTNETPTPTPTNTPAPTTATQNTAAPTSTAQGDNLPAAGISLPTLIAAGVGILFVLLSIALAI